MKRVLLLITLAGCPRARPAPPPAPEPQAHAVPPEIDWPDGGVDAG